MTVAVDLSRVKDFQERSEDFDIKSFKFRWGWKNSPRLKLFGYDKEEDVLWKAKVVAKRKRTQKCAVVEELSDKEIIGEWVYDFGVYGKYKRNHFVVDGEIKHRPHVDELDEDKEKGKITHKLKEHMRSLGFVEGEIKGSAQEMYTEVEVM